VNLKLIQMVKFSPGDQFVNNEMGMGTCGRKDESSSGKSLNPLPALDGQSLELKP